jgi:hypothetical protein
LVIDWVVRKYLSEYLHGRRAHILTRNSILLIFVSFRDARVDREHSIQLERLGTFKLLL